MVECEIKRDDVWEMLRITEALGAGNSLMRCAACHGRVIPTTECKGGEKAHFTHLVSYAYCSGDKGITSPMHPRQLS